MPEVFFNGPAGRLEARYTESSDKQAPAILLLHPHPDHGGTMNNKVVYHAYRTLVANNFSVLRINFRGVGRSQGEYDNGVGELTDAAAALDWLETNCNMASEIWIGGFSFGAWIAMQLIMRRPDINHFLAISPPVEKYDFSFLSPCPIPGLVIQGDQDSIVSEPAVADFVSRLSKQKHLTVDYKVIHGGDHFFRTRLEDLDQAIDEYAKQHLSGDPALNNTQSSNGANQRRTQILFD